MSTQVETRIQVDLEGRNRTTAFFRLILAIPAAIFASSFGSYVGDNGENFISGLTYSAGLLVLPVILAVAARGVYPSYALTLNHALVELNTRVSAYVLLLNDRYPTIEGNESVAVIFPDVEGGRKLNRGLVLVKWLLAIPLYLVGVVYSLYALVLAILGWVTVVSTGSMPASSAEGIVRVLQYWNRVVGYALALVTDEYPSFSL